MDQLQMIADPLKRQEPDNPEARQFLALRHQVEKQEVDGILRVALNSFAGKIAVISSFGAESVVLLHHVAQIDPTVPVLFLNTGKLFGETLRYRDRLQEVLGLTDVRTIGPHPSDVKRDDPDGGLWKDNAGACCHIRKVLPIRQALKGFDAQITGRKRFQTVQRMSLSKVERVDGRICFNPLADWTLEALTAYVAQHRLPKHPLISDGYLSIGCMPCTRRVRSGEGYRDGRWPDSDKDECGMHGEGI